MKQRIISGTIVGFITLTSILVGGFYFKAVVYFIMLWGSYEFVSSRKHKVNWLEYIVFILFCFMLNAFFSKVLSLVLFLIILLIILSIFDHRVSFADACVDFVECIILAFSCHYLLEIESYNLWFLGFIFIAAYITDLFAFLIGSRFGKHKLCERISPKKSVEGAIGGWLFGFLSSLIYAICLKFFNFESSFIIICSITMPIMSQIGDLTFSLIKRFYGIKDYSRLIPGHGGLLDRLDSVFFVLLIYGGLSALFI